MTLETLYIYKDKEKRKLGSFMFDFKLGELRKKGLIEEWAVLDIPQEHLLCKKYFLAFATTEKVLDRIIELYSKSFRLRKNVSFKKILNRLIKNLKKKLEPYEHILMIVDRDNIFKYYTISMYYIKSQDQDPLNKIKNFL